MKLKTLKDIGSIDHPFSYVADKEELKQEAIKWVKNCEKEEYNEAARVLKKMFNITEEDLK